jgi:hypothetical protein
MAGMTKERVCETKPIFLPDGLETGGAMRLAAPNKANFRGHPPPTRRHHAEQSQFGGARARIVRNKANFRDGVLCPPWRHRAEQSQFVRVGRRQGVDCAEQSQFCGNGPRPASRCRAEQSQLAGTGRRRPTRAGGDCMGDCAKQSQLPAVCGPAWRTTRGDCRRSRRMADMNHRRTCGIQPRSERKGSTRAAISGNIIGHE